MVSVSQPRGSLRGESGASGRNSPPPPAAAVIGEPLSSVELQGVNGRDEKKGEELRGWRWGRGGLSGRRR